MKGPTSKEHEALGLKAYLECSDPSKRWVQERLVRLLLEGAVAPSFSPPVLRLMSLVRDENVSLNDLADVISNDPGLTTQCLRAASSAIYGRGKVANIESALLGLGIKEIGRIANSVGVMDRFAHLKVKVDMKRFWLHSLLVARLAERVAAGYRQTTGLEYLAGLLLDIGKLVIEHNFPAEFDLILLRAWSRQDGYIQPERNYLGLDYTQIGAALCHSLNLDAQVRNAVWYHHRPGDLAINRERGDKRAFLPAVVSFADALAHMTAESLGGEGRASNSYEEIPAWKVLEQFDPICGLELDTAVELEAATADLQAFMP